MKELIPYLPTDRRHAIADGIELRDRTRGSALFVDISGFTPLAEGLAKDLGPKIRVNGVAPGAILWPENDLDNETRKDLLDRTALKRTGNADDIAAAVLFLHRDAAYVTGHMLPVDGGRLLNI